MPQTTEKMKRSIPEERQGKPFMGQKPNSEECQLTMQCLTLFHKQEATQGQGASHSPRGMKVSDLGVVAPSPLHCSLLHQISQSPPIWDGPSFVLPQDMEK